MPQLPAPVSHQEVRRSPTLLHLLDTTDGDLDFLNSPSWISFDNDLPSTPLRRQLPPLESLEVPSSSHDLPIDRGQLSLNLPVSQSPEIHDTHVPCPSFSTPQKLVPVEQVMKDYPGKDTSTLQKLSCALARHSIFGKHALRNSSLRGGGMSKTARLDKQKLEYIKAVVHTRVPELSAISFEAVW